MTLDSDKLRELCEKINLLEYAEKTVDFQRRGMNIYAAHCPRHEDKTPSLMVNPEKNLFYCHSCHVGGNILNWLMVFEHMKFSDAVKKVGELAGVDIDKIKTSEIITYFKQLKKLAENSNPKPIERAILPESYLDQFDHEEQPEEWLQEGISPEAMKAYGVCVDRSANRICYPIYDNNDNLIAVKGRSRYENYKEMRLQKYINYQRIQTTDFFLGMKQNREIIKEQKSVILFEGIKSGMKLYSWGEINNWLACETSRINEAQVKILIGMHIKDVIIAFDRDVEMSEIRQCTTILRRFCNVYVVRDRYNENRLLPGDKDSPVDAGEDVWLQLYSEKRRLR